MKYKIIIVDDHDTFRSGLKMLFNNGNIAEVIAEARNGVEFLEIIGNHTPDLVLMDIDMPKMNGIEATKKAIALHPDLNILVLSMYGDEKFYHKMIFAGAKGFVLKTSGIDELEEATKCVCEGENYFSHDLLSKIINGLEKKEEHTEEASDFVKMLTDKEIEVLKYLCNGQTLAGIAEEMGVKESTIKAHKKNLMIKTGANNTASLIIAALKNEVIAIEN